MSLNSDFKDLLKSLADFQVKYLVVGGYAVMFYTEPRYTKDLDIWIEASEENSKRIFAALSEFGAPLTGMSADDFAHEGFFYQLGLPPIRIDILMSIPGVSFADAWPRLIGASYGEQRISLISKADLITSKKASGRHIDLHDVEQLTRDLESGDPPPSSPGGV